MTQSVGEGWRPAARSAMLEPSSSGGRTQHTERSSRASPRGRRAARLVPRHSHRFPLSGDTCVVHAARTNALCIAPGVVSGLRSRSRTALEPEGTAVLPAVCYRVRTRAIQLGTTRDRNCAERGFGEPRDAHRR